MTREASSERSVARTSYEVSGLRFGCVLTVCFERLSWVPCWGPAIPPPPIPPSPPRLLTGRSLRMVRRGQYGPPGRPAKDPSRPKGPLNGMRAGASPSSPPPFTHPDLPSSRPPIHFTLTVAPAILLNVRLLRSFFELALVPMHEDSRQFLTSAFSFVSPIFSCARKLFPLSVIIKIILIIVVFAIVTVPLIALIITQIDIIYFRLALS